MHGIIKIHHEHSVVYAKNTLLFHFGYNNFALGKFELNGTMVIDMKLICSKIMSNLPLKCIIAYGRLYGSFEKTNKNKTNKTKQKQKQDCYLKALMLNFSPRVKVYSYFTVMLLHYRYMQGGQGQSGDSRLLVRQ